MSQKYLGKEQQNSAGLAFEKEKTSEVLHKMYKQRHLYILLLPAIILTFFYKYCPMPGLIMAFEDFSIYDGLFGSEWVGLKNIKIIFGKSNFTTAIWNTLSISLLSLVLNFPMPIILALLINEIGNKRFKKFVQTASYLPHFLSWISVVGIVQSLFSREGFVNDVLVFLGAKERVAFLAEQGNFIWFVLFTTMWKGVGWGTVIHLANLSSIDPTLYEAADIDGAGHLQKLWHITIPHMIPTVIILLIFQMGGLFGSNFELIYGLQNPFIDFEVISTIIYNAGLQNGNYSMSTAIGFLEGIVSLFLVLGANWISKKTSGSGIL